MSYPSKDSNVFQPSCDSKTESMISSQFFLSKYYEYEIAYKEAGDKLVDKAIEDGSLFLSVSVYPITFLYRQFLELYIKDILFRYSLEYQDDKKLQKTHDVYVLWGKLFEEIIHNQHSFPEEISGQSFNFILKATDQYLEEISAFDQKSMAFRYPDSIKNKRNFFPNEISVDIINLRDRVTELANVLCVIEECFAALKTIESEMNCQMV